MAKKKLPVKTEDNQIDFWEESKTVIDIRNCSFGFKCEQKWEGLLKRKEPNIRYCHDCEKEVYLIETNDELVDAIKDNHCVAVRVKLDKHNQHKLSTKSENITVGMLSSVDYDSPSYKRK